MGRYNLRKRPKQEKPTKKQQKSAQRNRSSSMVEEYVTMERLIQMRNSYLEVMETFADDQLDQLQNEIGIQYVGNNIEDSLNRTNFHLAKTQALLLKAFVKAVSIMNNLGY